jgi:hypothetical protein
MRFDCYFGTWAFNLGDDKSIWHNNFINYSYNIGCSFFCNIILCSSFCVDKICLLFGETMEKYICKRFEDLKDGEMVMAYGMHVFRWDFDLYGDPSYAFVPVPDDEAEKEENE